MRISEMLVAMAAWLESPNNEALLLAEADEGCSKIVAENCVLAAALLKSAAEQVEEMEAPEPSKITPEAIESLASLADVFDASGDPDLKKQASVLDELLLTIAAPPNALAERKAASDDRIEQLRKKYQEPKTIQDEANRADQAKKAIDKSKMTEKPVIRDQPLSTRTCPQHPGAQIRRIGEHTWQCSLDKRVYNYDVGFTLDDGTKVPGGSVDLQTANSLNNYSQSVFDDRIGRLQSNR